MTERELSAGAATLPVVLLMSAIVVELAVLGVVLAAVFGNTIFSSRLATEALSAARAGADDAIRRVILYQQCPATGCPASYSITVGSRSTADVTITSGGGGILTINSTGISSSRKKKIEAVLGVDSSTGKVNIQSYKEISL